MPTKISPVGSSASGGGSIGPTTPTDFTEGAVIFAGASELAEDPTAFSFDPTTNTLSVAKIAALNSGYGFANAGLTFANGTQLNSSADGTLWVGSSFSNSDFGVANGLLQILIGSGYQYIWTSTSNPAAGAADTGMARTGAGIVKITNGGSGAGALHLQEQTAPSAPATNNVYLYAQDNGAGKTQLMALFATGAAQQVAIEP